MDIVITPVDLHVCLLPHLLLFPSTVHNIWPAWKRDGGSYRGRRCLIQKVCLAYVWIYVFMRVRTWAVVLSRLPPPQSDRPAVRSVATEAERSLPQHHRGRPPAAGSGCKAPQLQGGASSSRLHVITHTALLCTPPETLKQTVRDSWRFSHACLRS